MALTFKCPTCGKSLVVNFLKIGEEAKCTHCNSQMPVPSNSEECESTFNPINKQIQSTTNSETIEDAKLTGIPLKLRNILIVGFIQLFVITLLINKSNTSIEMFGTYMFKLGAKTVTITPSDGMEYHEENELLSRYPKLQLAFILKRDTSYTIKLEIFADIQNIPEHKNLESLSDYFTKDTEEKNVPLFLNRIQGDNLNIIMQLENDGEIYYMYIRYFQAYPYYLRVFSTYQGDSNPSQELLDELETIKVESK